jgi:hypothetical protein
MLNPSTADADKDDPTIRRCITFSERWGYSKLIVVNLYAMRATNPQHLLKDHDPIGRENRGYIQEAIQYSSTVMAAWGAFKMGVPQELVRLLQDCNLWCLGTTKNGSPKHPLYVSSITDRERFQLTL